MSPRHRKASPHAVRVVWLVAVGILILVILTVSAVTSAGDTEHSPAPYHSGPQWPAAMTELCIEDHTGGFPVEQAADEFAEFVPMVVTDDCTSYPYTVEVRTVILQDEVWAGWFDSRQGEDGLRERGRVRLNLRFAYRLTPSDWRVLLVHELGHALGLEHTHEGESAMAPGEKMYAHDGLTEQDREQLREIYGG